MPYAEIDGARLHVRQRGAGEVALFIHGFPLDSSMWLAQLESLSDVRRCIAVDLRGFGRSCPVDGSPLTMEQHASDLAGVLDIVSVEQADIVGLSMGGYVALALAEMYPDRIRTLALVDTKSEGDSELARKGRDATAARLLEDGRTALAEGMQEALLAPQASLGAKARVRTMIEGCAYETIVGALAGLRDRPDRTHVLETIAAPSAVLVGEDDTVTPPADAGRMAAALPDCTLTVIPNAGHMAPIEHPTAVNAALRELWARAAD